MEADCVHECGDERKRVRKRNERVECKWKEGEKGRKERKEGREERSEWSKNKEEEGLTRVSNQGTKLCL